MDTVKYYTTICSVFDYLVEIHEKTGKESSFPSALDDMRRRGPLQPSPSPLPPFCSNLDREGFLAFIRALPISADMILEQAGPASGYPMINEPPVFPAEKDVFCFLNMPYMDRKLHSRDFFEITYSARPA